ncbi:hypothetical protein [Stenotrophomonas sp. DR009]|uniref:hypothetical protein n=1 Tax=Stenotrophomonas sp. DR009 TaxID=3398461 RepID=UPI003BB15E0A
MKAHYLVLASCICLIVFLCWGAWFVYRYEAYELTVSGLILAVFVALFAHDELHIIRKKRNDRFKQPPLTTERG